MTDERFKAEIHKPYVEAWKIMKIIQYIETAPNTDELWETWYREQERLFNAYPGNKYVEELCRLLMVAAEHIKEINKNESC